MFEGMLQWLAHFVSEATVARAIAFALVSGMMLTQWIKFQLPDWLSDKAHAGIVRLTSSLLALLTVLAMWPDERGAASFAVALGTGLTTPFAYWIGVKMLYQFFPWTEDVISARPSPPPVCTPSVTVPPNREEPPT